MAKQYQEERLRAAFGQSRDRQPKRKTPGLQHELGFIARCEQSSVAQERPDPGGATRRAWPAGGSLGFGAKASLSKASPRTVK